MSGPLTGITVVEFTNLIAGPHAGMMLADLGAQVIKVEPPSGDLGRGFGPYVDGESVFFQAANRGKRSIALDLRSEPDRQTALELCAISDVLIHNLRLGAMERAGLGEDDVRAINPTIVYAVVSAFASQGPEATRAGIDVVFQAESGMVSISGDQGGPPAKTATTIGDYVAATNTALAVCAALVDRAHTGRGRRVDVSLRDGLLSVQGGWNALAFATGAQPERTGTASPYLAPNQVFATEDGHIAVAIVSDRHFESFCDSLGRPDLAQSFPTNDSRMEARAELIAEIAPILAAGTADDWTTKLAAAGLPVGRVRTLAEAFAAAPHMRLDIGPMPVTGSPIKIDGETAVTRSPAPRLGEHGGEIRSELAARHRDQH
jgi:crotonobetainyl-CoA:carnitine CoA-transferase CaiB-like acyl-CoA transferase